MGGFLRFLIICLASCAVCACGRNSTGNDIPPKGRSSLTVTISEGTGPGLSGFEITTTPATRSSITDSTGSAFIPDIPLGNYTVFAKKDGYPPVSKDVVLEGEPNFTRFTFLPLVTVTVVHETKGPIVNAVIETTPPGIAGRTDTNGRAFFERVPEQLYTFTIRRNGYPDITFEGIVPKPEISLYVKSASPEVSILSPEAGAVFPGGRPIRFTGSGTDLEDGALPDSSLVWYSDPDGVLGRGREMTVAALSLSRHTVSLRGTDSDGDTSERSIAITVADYQLDSYFPLPSGEWWKYRFLVPEFYVTAEDGGLEYWVMKDLTVRTYEGPVRRVTMLYDIVRGMKTLHFRYTLTDNLEIQNGNVSINQTTESLDEWETGTPYQTINVMTQYSPSYPILRHVTDITAEKVYSTTVNISVTWWYDSYGITSQIYYEWETLTVTNRIGDEREIETEKGIFRAIEVTVSEKSIEKKWWLAKGIGLVQFEDNSFSPKATALMSDAGLLRFQEQARPTAKPADAIALPSSSAPVFRFDRRTPDGMRALHRFLAGMCPR